MMSQTLAECEVINSSNEMNVNGANLSGCEEEVALNSIGLQSQCPSNKKITSKKQKTLTSEIYFDQQRSSPKSQASFYRMDDDYQNQLCSVVREQNLSVSMSHMPFIASGEGLVSTSDCRHLTRQSHLAAISTCSIENEFEQYQHRQVVISPEIERIQVNEAFNEEPNLLNSVDLETSNNIDYLLSLLPPNDLQEMPYADPIIIRGNGNITLFGLSNSFSNTFPSTLLGRVSREEFEYTINKINQLLQQHHSTNAKFLILGCICCCFSLGCSLLWPTLALSRRTRSSLDKLLSMENCRLYNKLGLNWRLSKQQCHTNHSFVEYILVIDFLPKMHIYQPD